VIILVFLLFGLIALHDVPPLIHKKQRGTLWVYGALFVAVISYATYASLDMGASSPYFVLAQWMKTSLGLSY
jgi:hypothetical protein